MPSFPSPVSADMRWRMIAEAAWFRFQRRGYVHGHHEQDWIDAEREIDQLLAQASRGGATAKDDLIIIEGIGPKIAEVLAQAGITTFAQLAAAAPAAIKALLDRAGARFAMANPASWPQQAALAAKGDWVALKQLQDRLTAGVAKA